MNIFALDKDPVFAAKYHCDKHCVKMILEYCQLLCTAHRMIDGELYTGKTKTGRNVKRWKLPDHRDTVLYSATHVNHPSAVWVRQHASHYQWLHTLLGHLLDEYTYRYNKTHKCERDGLYDELRMSPCKINTSLTHTFTYPTPAMPDYCKVPGDVIASYRKYYNMEKQRMFAWKNRPVPFWIVTEKQEELV